jgi:ABC-type phosphate transport system substrate-binding protein
VGVALGALAVIGLTTLGPAGPAQATTPAAIIGAGSSYAYNAINQWATDEEAHGLSISFNPDGSAQGRQQYEEDQVDFAGTDIAYITKSNPDPFGGSDPTVQTAYSYVPDVAGGLSFLYNIQVDGRKITNMRLSGKTLAEIFTGQITNWDNPQITHDYGAQLPSIPITVVTRSDGAGESYFLTNWMMKEYPSIWEPYCKARGGGSLCDRDPTEYYPVPSGDASFHSLNGADDVAGYVNSSVNNGAIGYAEYSYALPDHIPVVSMLNAAGYYVGPTAANVAIALEAAGIDENPSDVNFLMQNLNNVYGDKDPRTYPLSSYSYLVVPRNSRPSGSTTLKPPSSFSAGKGLTLSTYVGYMLCQAQQDAAQLGYSPLPKPMVQGGFTQYNHIPGYVANPAGEANYNDCDNPAYHDGVDLITKNAPYPNACQKVGSPLNCKVVGGKAVSTAASGGGGSGGGGSGGGGSGGSATSGGKAGASATASGAAQTNPNTGQVEGASGTGVNADVQAEPVGLAGSPSSQLTFGVLTGLELLAAVAVPAGLGTWLQRRRRRPPAGPPPSPNGFPPPGYTRPPGPGTPPPIPGPVSPSPITGPPAPGSSPADGPGSPPPSPGSQPSRPDSPPTGLIPPVQNGDAD